MADKPCRYVLHSRDLDEILCTHPLGGHWCPEGLGLGMPILDTTCQGCPCHEPQPDPTTDTCLWWRDEHGNWYCACSDTLPDFTPWRGTAPDGCFCPKCGEVITVRVHDKP